MARQRTTTQAQIARAIKGAQSAGLKPAKVEVEPSGKIVIYTEAVAATPETELDEWINHHGSRQT